MHEAHSDSDALIVADHIRQCLAASGVSPLDMTSADVLQIMLDEIDVFHEYPADKAQALAEEILAAWRKENAN